MAEMKGAFEILKAFGIHGKQPCLESRQLHLSKAEMSYVKG